MAAETRPGAYSHYIGHVHVGGDTNVDIVARYNAAGRQVEISRTRDHQKRTTEIPAGAAARIADVLSGIEDWDELTALVRLLNAAAKYEGGSR